METQRRARRGRGRGSWIWGLTWSLLAGVPTAHGAFTQPWDALETYYNAAMGQDVETWIRPSNQDPTLTVYTANAGTYEVGFDLQNKKGQASGMKALKLSYQGATEGHLAAAAPAGQFSVVNTGDNRTFTDLLLLVAVDADALGPTFGMSLGTPGQVGAYSRDDFAYYDPSAAGYLSGRPAGYFGGTNPSREEIAYDFTEGMVTMIALPGADLGPLGDEMAVDFAFTDLPGKAVFSVYGWDAQRGWVYHTNRSTQEIGNEGVPVSTFEVAPTTGPGDSTVPEPGTMALALLALGSLGTYVRRRR